MTPEQKKELSDTLYIKYVAEYNRAKSLLRKSAETKDVSFWSQAVDVIKNADKINLMRLALM